MINSQEMLFVVDEHNQPIQSLTRSKVHKNKLWHRTSGIWVVNSVRQILCQKRSILKDTNPGKWEAFFGGHLAESEEYAHNAVYEIGEELGVTVHENNLIPYREFQSDKPTHKEFQMVFALQLDKKSPDFVIEQEEIDEVVWKDLNTVRQILIDLKDPGWVQKPWDAEVISWLKSSVLG